MRFLHTSDWQLGMTRHFLGEEAQARFTDARFEAIREIGRLAQRERCEFVVVSGDVFETNQVDRKTVARACDALGAISAPVFLLPGNHDPLDAGSVYRGALFRDRAPAHVTVLEDSRPRAVRPGVEVVGAPWRSKRPLCDLAAEAAESLEPRPGVLRVLVAHGAVDTLSPNPDDPARVLLERAREAIAAGRVHYLALGDRHSLTRVDEAGRIWYSGTPVSTDFGEEHPNHALVVELDDTTAQATAHAVGDFRFVDEARDLANDADLDALESFLAALERKDRTVLRLSLRGTLTLQQHARLLQRIEHGRDLLAAIELWERNTQLVVLPTDADFADLSLGGFARDAVDTLRATVAAGGADAATARDALALLVRLSGGGA